YTHPFFKSAEASSSRYTGALNDRGVTCAVRRRETDDEDDAEEGETDETDPDEEDDAELYQLLLTRDLSYGEEEFQELRELREEDMRTFQEELGRFLGYPEEDVEAFAANATALYLDRSGYLGTPETPDDYDITDDDLRMALTFHAPRRGKDDHSDERRTARARYRALQAMDELYGTDFADRAHTYAERRRTDDWISDQQTINWMLEFSKEREDGKSE
ncbi:MAG: hypothetical protein SVU32_04835, partial [Candidatus Nanohaloarchaea archaeon]|nr:hypothetical protein [Candidatus Nanohaloarchaea archaeon]